MDGNVALLFSSKCSLKMPVICFAHKWSITAIAATTSLIHNNQPDNIALVTYEHHMEDIFHVWGLSVSESDGTITLRCYISVLLKGIYPHRFLLTDNTLAIVVEGKRLALLDIPRTPQRNEQILFTDYPQRNHEPEDSHKSNINSLLFFPALKMFITGSNDGVIKAWDIDNQLVADLDIGWPVSSVGFANEIGDLLISHHNVITQFSSCHYLPSEYTSGIITTKSNFVDKPIPFNPNLKFW